MKPQSLNPQSPAAQPVRVSPAWLSLREPADAAARAPGFADQIRRLLGSGRRAVIHDLGSGTGSMARWLAPRLPGEQHWILYDRDAELLDQAAACSSVSSDGAAVTVETRQRDITRLDPSELAGASLITASALLDMLTAEELNRLIRSCVEANCPVLLTISVIGRVEIRPPDPLDEPVAEAFNAHQRRTTRGRRLLGPDAVGVAAEEFTRLGADVAMLPSPWRIGVASRDQAAPLLDRDARRSGRAAVDADLMTAWFRGWLGAALEQRPELAITTAEFARRREAQAAAGLLGVTVHHRDLLALPR